MHENSDFMIDINDINIELSGNRQRYVNKCSKSEANGKIDGFSAGSNASSVAEVAWCECIRLCSGDASLSHWVTSHLCIGIVHSFS
jgi:hypothetical protein